MSDIAALNQHIDELQTRIQELEYERNLLFALIDTVPDYLFVKDRQSRFLMVNKAMSDLHNEPRNAMMGKSDMDYSSKGEVQEFYEDEQRLMETGTTRMDREEINIAPDGSKIWVSTTKLSIKDDEGRIIGLAGIARDITQQKQIQMELQKQADIISAQQQAFMEVSAPILPIFDQVLVMPLIGTIDSQRAQTIMRGLLAGISTHRAKIIILDITGVPLIDTGVADYLNRAIQAARLKGAQAIITGVSEAVAETLVDLGIDWSHVETLRDLQSGLHRALEKRIDD